MKFATKHLTHLLVSALLATSSNVFAVDFTTENDTPAELETVEYVKKLMAEHDLSKWQFTDKVHIKSRTIPHSHPVLTLHTRHTIKGHEDILLSTYLHEQIHWHIGKNIEQSNAAIKELTQLFEQVPVGYPQGGNDEYSTYMHILVCYLEQDAMTSLISQARVDKLAEFWRNDHYTWIYQTVLDNKALIGAIIDKHGLRI